MKKTTNKILQDNLKKFSRVNNANPELAKMNQSSASRGFSIIPAVALKQYNEQVVKSGKGEVQRVLDVRSGQYDWTKGSTGVDLLHQDKTLVVPSTSLLLDLYPDASAAYSLRKLRTVYNGSAVRVRRSSDNTEQDIGFDSNGDLDTTALLSFVGAGDGFVTKRYDQSGNGYDLEQTAASAQPKIVNAGALYTFNGNPYFLTDGVDDLMRTTTNPIFGTDPRSLFFVQKSNVAGITCRFNLASDTGLVGRTWIITPEVAVRTNVTTWVSSTPTSITSPSLISNIYTSGNLHSGNSMWLDGSLVTRTSGSDGAIDTIDSNMTEGANPNAFFYDGYISESIIYKTDQTANRVAIETNINDYYGIY
jgi:hypothetical protein